MSPTEHHAQTNDTLSPEIIRRFRFNVLTACSFAMSVSVWSWLVGSWQLAIQFPWRGILVCQVFALLGYVYYALTRNFRVLRLTQLMFMLFVPLVAQLSMESGHVSAIILWSFLAPISVSMIQAREERNVLPWLAGYVIVVLAASLLAPRWGTNSQYATDIIIGSLLPINLAVFTCLLTLALFYLLRHRAEMDSLRRIQYLDLHEQHTKLNFATLRKDTLLNSVLPDRIAERLLRNNEMIADGHSDVSVIFVDIVGFTQLADTMSPKQIVRLLNQLFSGFDEVAERHGLEKIKTIGDGYLAVGGIVNQEVDNYVEATVRAAQGFQQYIRQHTDGLFEGRALDVHIGIATGPVAAGVIGKVRLTYDIWGNTVNVASRLADQSLPGQILVDQTTFKRISKKFEFTQENELTLKGDIRVNVYKLMSSSDPRPVDGSNIFKMHA